MLPIYTWDLQPGKFSIQRVACGKVILFPELASSCMFFNYRCLLYKYLRCLTKCLHGLYVKTYFPNRLGEIFELLHWKNQWLAVLKYPIFWPWLAHKLVGSFYGLSLHFFFSTSCELFLCCKYWHPPHLPGTALGQCSYILYMWVISTILRFYMHVWWMIATTCFFISETFISKFWSEQPWLTKIDEWLVSHYLIV